MSKQGKKEQLKIAARTARLNNLVVGRTNGGDGKDDSNLEVAISREGLLDSLFVLYDECSKDVIKKKDKNIAEFVSKYRPIIKETRSLRVNVDDFDVKCLIGKGYFGDVHLISERQTGQVYAMKKMRKDIVSSTQVREERDIMASRRSEWITGLQYAFQDSDYLYLVMEYLPGGDLLCLMRRVGIFDEEVAQFYLAEMTAALHAVHEIGYVHRDVKPENILIDRFGHLKLVDFGNATAINEDGSVTSMTPVGTPDYIAPELLQTLATVSRSTNRAKHDVTCDFWSMGIIGYEFVTEETPFHGDNVNETYSKILAHAEGRFAKKLSYPAHASISAHYRDFLDRLVTNVANRMSHAEIVRHPFFSDLHWDRLRYMIPPIIPTVSADDDTSNFEDADKVGGKRKSMVGGGRMPTYNIARMNDFSGHDLRYLGYGYVYEEPDVAGMYRDTDEHMKAARLAAKVKEQDRRLKEHSGEIHRLQREVLERDRKIATMGAHSKILDETKKELESMKDLLKEKTAELAAIRTDNKTLRNSLKIEKEQRQKNDAQIADVVKQTYKKWEKAKQASDQAYERQLAERKTELAAANEKLREVETELVARLDECQHLHASVENYKDLLKKSKEKLMADKESLDRSQQELIATYDAKIAELRGKWKVEKEKRAGMEAEVRELREKLQEQESSVQFVEETKQKLVDNIKRRMTMQLEENNMLREAKQFSDKMSEEMQRKCDNLRNEISKLQEQTIVTATANSSVDSSRRSSLVYEQEFRSANSSLQDVTAIIVERPNIEAQLRNDLIKARESENEQRKRAENLEEVVGRLEKVIDQLKTSGTGSSGAESLLEKQNERLEDKLSAIREQAILDKQSARTANLSLWKLEKELESLRGEKSILTRRMEQADERVTRIRHEKEELEFKMKQQRETIANRDKQIEDLRSDLAGLKDELKKERDLWSSSEKDRLAEKTELIECVAKIQSLEEKLKDSQQKHHQLNDRVRVLSSENGRLGRELHEALDELAEAKEASDDLEQRLAGVTKNFNLLKGACNITEAQLSEMEILLEKESKRNKECAEQMEALRKRLIEKDNEVERVRQELYEERSGKTLSESRSNHLLGEYEELRKKFEELQQQMVDQQRELIEKTSHLFEVQERIELLNHDAENLQKVVANYEQNHFILKEENARILTDLFLAKEHITRQQNEIKEHKNHTEQAMAELEHVKLVLQEQKTFYTERDIKSEATLAQHKKLIDYLQAKVEECNAHSKKKKTLAGLIFGTSSSTERKENVPPNIGTNGGGVGNNVPVESTASYRKLQEELQKERTRTNQLKEQLLRAKTDLIASQGSNNNTSMHKKQQKDDENMQVEKTHREERVPDRSTKDTPVEDTQRRHSSKETGSANKRSTGGANAPGKAHTFDMTIESTSSASKNPAILCAACDRLILAGHPYWKCTDCGLTVHRKCRSSVTSKCGDGGNAGTIVGRESEKANESLDDFAEELGMVDDEQDEEEGGDEDTDVDSLNRLHRPSGRKSPAFSMTSSAEEKAEEDRYVGDLLFKTKRLEPRLFVNDIYEVSEKAVLLGCDTGLYSYHLETSEVVHIRGISNVRSFAVSPVIPKAILIGSEGEYLYQCDLRHLQSRAHASSCLQPKLESFVLDLSIANRTHSERWHIVRMMENIPAGGSLSDAIAIAATSSRIVILKFDVQAGRFKPVRGLDTVLPVSSVLFTKDTAIVGSDKFFEIDLRTYAAEEFLDMSDASLRDIRNCAPLAAFRINSQEFLLCYREVGIFVDDSGWRSRPDNLSWLQDPVEFYYRESCLFIAHADCVQVMYISKSYTKDLACQQSHADDERRAFIGLRESPRLLAPLQFPKTSLYIACECQGADREQEIVLLDGMKALRTVGFSRSLETLSSLATGVGQSQDSLATLGQGV
ncbi:AGAP006932-PA-like protein [Anopheles sinensis]|uniref:non-specific serine/threonine protein kinase n=1 Tax=Anopheles sinensis TaxID=74873 RepID=A0A084W131_ANOSI|nr:AGAP006932-PA-like protein [Anopheles sinensis]